MKKLCLMLCFVGICSTSALHANPNPWQHLPLQQQGDSLKKTIGQLGKNGLDSIIALSGHLQHIAGELKDGKFMAYAVSQKAWAYKHKNDLAQSVRHYFQLETLYQQQQNTAGLGTAYYNIGMIFAKGHAPDKAIAYLEKAKGYYQAAGQGYKVSLALYDLSKRYIEKGEPGTAAAHLISALNHCPDEKALHKSMIYTRLGWAAKDRKDYRRARMYYRRSVGAAGASPKWDKKQAIALNNIGETYLLEGRYDSAGIYLQQALEVKKGLGDPDFTLSTLTTLGQLAYQQGDPRRAFEWLGQGIAKVDPTKLSDNVSAALALASMMASGTASNLQPSSKAMATYMHLQQQQFLALQALKGELDSYGIHTGEGLYAQETENRVLQLSVKKTTYTFGGISAFVLIFGAAGLVYGTKQKVGQRHAVQDKNAFVSEQVKNYDEKILRMLILNAQYEEIKQKLKREFGLGDDDFKS